MKLCDIAFITKYRKECKQTFKHCVWWDTKKKECKWKEWQSE